MNSPLRLRAAVLAGSIIVGGILPTALFPMISSAADQPFELILDNDNAAVFSEVGPWSSSEAETQGYNGKSYHYIPKGDGSAVATWHTEGIPAGRYDIQTTWTHHINRASNAPFTIFDGSTDRGTVRISEENVPQGFTVNGWPFQTLGFFDIASGNITIKLTNDANEYVISDTIRLVRVGDIPADPAATFEVVLDNDNPAQFSEVGPWSKTEAETQGYNGQSYHYIPKGDGSAVATWHAEGLPSGKYEVHATWTHHINRASNAPFTIFDGSTNRGTVYVSEENVPNGVLVNGWPFQSIGTFEITSGNVVITLTNDANEYVISDAIRLVRVGDAASAASEVEIVEVPTTFFHDLYSELSNGMESVPVVEVSSFNASKYSLTPGTIPSGMGTQESLSINERLARGISMSNEIGRTGFTYYDQNRGVDVYAGNSQFFIEYDNGAVELMMVPDGVPAGQHPLVNEVPHGGRNAPDLGQVPKEVLRTGLTFFDAARGIDVYASEGHYLIEYVDQTIEQRPLPAGGFVPRPEDFTFGGEDNSQDRSEFGPSMQELGIVNGSSSPKPSSELVLIGDQYVSSAGQLRVAKEGTVFLQDPVTRTILLRPAADAAVAQPNNNPIRRELASHDVSEVTSLFVQAYGRSPTAQELKYWRQRTDKSGPALLGAMQFAYQQEQDPNYGPEDVQRKLVGGFSLNGNTELIAPNTLMVGSFVRLESAPEVTSLQNQGSTQAVPTPYLIKDFENWGKFIDWLEDAAELSCNTAPVSSYIIGNTIGASAGLVATVGSTSFCVTYDLAEAIQEDLQNGTVSNTTAAVATTVLEHGVSHFIVSAAKIHPSTGVVRFVEGGASVAGTVFDYHGEAQVQGFFQSLSDSAIDILHDLGF